jgi:hypothetical protein
MDDPLLMRWEKYGDKRDFGRRSAWFFTISSFPGGCIVVTVAVAAQGSEYAGAPAGEVCTHSDEVALIPYSAIV